MTINPHAAECPRRQDAPGGRAEQARHLLDLAERCEQATGADFALDHDIVAALDIEHQNRWAMAENAGVEPNPFPLPRYTASLDAAMALVPEGCGFTAQHLGHPAFWTIFVPGGAEYGGHGHTPALALCAAALRAKGAAQ